MVLPKDVDKDNLSIQLDPGMYDSVDIQVMIYRTDIKNVRFKVC